MCPLPDIFNCPSFIFGVIDVARPEQSLLRNAPVQVLSAAVGFRI
jgi:hypothetical protein